MFSRLKIHEIVELHCEHYHTKIVFTLAANLPFLTQRTLTLNTYCYDSTYRNVSNYCTVRLKNYANTGGKKILFSQFQIIYVIRAQYLF